MRRNEDNNWYDAIAIALIVMVLSCLVVEWLVRHPAKWATLEQQNTEGK